MPRTSLPKKLTIAIGCALLSLAFVSLSAIPVSAVEAKMARHPAPSPDASKIAFSWQGDLWIVPFEGGIAQRLTSHPAADRHPVWSHDGASLAFASDRHGNLDVFVMPLDGSRAPRRLSFASIDDFPLEFSIDDQSVLFSSRRRESLHRLPEVYTVPITGGTPAWVQKVQASSFHLSPDGERAVMVRGGSRWTRRGYRGSGSFDLWIRESAASYRKLTDFDGDDLWPSWVGRDRLAYASARSGRKNVFLIAADGDGEPEALTFHDDFDVRFPRASYDGSAIAYEYGDGIWTVATDGGDAKQVVIEVPADLTQNRILYKNDSSGAQELSISPDGKTMAVIVRGEVFVTALRSEDDQKIAKPATVRVTRTPARETGLSWSPDGNELVISSDREGQRDLYKIRRGDEDRAWGDSFDFVVERLTATIEHEEYDARFSPDGERILFVRDRGDLWTMPAEGGEPTLLASSFNGQDWSFSPDGRFVAYSVPDLEFNTDVWVVPVTGGTPYNVSRHPDADRGPVWSPDGKRLFWSTRRHGDTFDVWGAWLTQADHERKPEGWLQVWSGDDKKDSEKSDEGDDEEGDEKVELPEVKIDFDRLWERGRALTDDSGQEVVVGAATDGKRIVFNAEANGEEDLFSIGWNGDDWQRLTTGGQEPESVELSADGETIFYLDGDGKAHRIAVEDGESGDPMPFKARYEVDLEAERKVVFEEAWREIDLRFYDPDFHGVTWAAQRQRYLPLAMGASHDRDLADVINIMLGELNASHMGYRPNTDNEGDSTGWIGVRFDPEAGGPGILISDVLPDSPADAVDCGLSAGDRLLAVNGTAVDEGTNVYALFDRTVGHRIPLEVRKAEGGESSVVVFPVSFGDRYRLRYQQWVRERRAIVDRLSEGRLGYIHIQGMNISSFERFEQGLFAAASGREGLVVDVRSNGGGWTTDYLMAVLMVKRHAYTIPRGTDASVKAYPQSRLPLSAWTRPAITLCNEESYSNAEIFSWAFQVLERGKVVGMTTFGAVISTGGTVLQNGAGLRLPFRGWFVAGSDINMEKQGAVPDILVEQPVLDDLAPDSDAQLERAVQELLSSLADDPRSGAW